MRILTLCHQILILASGYSDSLLFRSLLKAESESLQSQSFSEFAHFVRACLDDRQFARIQLLVSVQLRLHSIHFTTDVFLVLDMLVFEFSHLLSSTDEVDVLFTFETFTLCFDVLKELLDQSTGTKYELQQYLFACMKAILHLGHRMKELGYPSKGHLEPIIILRLIDYHVVHRSRDSRDGRTVHWSAITAALWHKTSAFPEEEYLSFVRQMQAAGNWTLSWEALWRVLNWRDLNRIMDILDLHVLPLAHRTGNYLQGLI